MSEDVGGTMSTLDPLRLLTCPASTLASICTLPSLVFSSGLSRAALIFYSVLISPNCCVMTHNMVMFQIWRKTGCWTQLLLSEVLGLSQQPRACQRFYAFCDLPTFFSPLPHPLKLSNCSPPHLCTDFPPPPGGGLTFPTPC